MAYGFRGPPVCNVPAFIRSRGFDARSKNSIIFGIAFLRNRGYLQTFMASTSAGCIRPSHKPSETEAFGLFTQSPP